MGRIKQKVCEAVTMGSRCRINALVGVQRDGRDVCKGHLRAKEVKWREVPVGEIRSK